MQSETGLIEINHCERDQEASCGPKSGLTIEIFSEDGSRLRFAQNDQESNARITRALASPLLFSQPFLTLASEQSVSTIPSRIIDMVLVRTRKMPPPLLPPGWLDIVEVDPKAFYTEAVLNEAGMPSRENAGAKANRAIFHAVIHTIGNSMVALRLLAGIEAPSENQSQRLARFFNLPVLPFRLEPGGAGFINPAKISHLTIYPALEGVNETALPAYFLQCIRL